MSHYVICLFNCTLYRVSFRKNELILHALHQQVEQTYANQTAVLHIVFKTFIFEANQKQGKNPYLI